MCDINKKTKLKTVTGYKLCWKEKDTYYSHIVRSRIDLGKINSPRESVNVFNYNYIMKQFKLCTILKKLAVARKHYHSSNISTLVLLKITLGGIIYKGTDRGYTNMLDNNIVYAGSEILSYQEIDLRGRPIGKLHSKLNK